MRAPAPSQAKTGPFPVPHATLPFWRTQLHPLDSHRSTTDLPRECDILIIGAGLSGVSTAYNLLLDNPTPPSIVLLEAREVCSGATGRNGKSDFFVFRVLFPLPLSLSIKLLNKTLKHIY